MNKERTRSITTIKHGYSEYDIGTPEGIASFLSERHLPYDGGYPRPWDRVAGLWVIVEGGEEEYLDISVYSDLQMKEWACDVRRQCNSETAYDELIDILDMTEPPSMNAHE